MELAHDLRSAGITAADSTRERLSAVLQLLEVGVTGKTAGWHDGLLSQWPGVRISSRKGDWPEMSTTRLAQVGFALSADRGRPARPPIINRSRPPRHLPAGSTSQHLS